MEASSRKQKISLNFVFSLMNNVVSTVLGFVIRTVFIYYLGVEYLGLSGLFSNVLSLLSLTELGVGSAITFSLYKPIAEKNLKKLKALMQLYKKAYILIGTVIMGLGLLLLPFLQYIVNLNAGIEINYYIIYLLFLFNSVVSYWFFAYRSVIVYANQEGYILTNVETICSIISAVLQLLVLAIFHNYYIYLIIPIVIGIIKNCIVSYIAGKKYPVILEKTKEELPQEERKDIFKNVCALSLYKISGVVYSSTDNIIISTCLGTAVVGVLSNYTMVTTLVSRYVNMFFQSMYASVGNLNATESVDYKFSIYKKLQFINDWIYTYCAICLGCFLNPLISVWLGKEYVFKNSTAVLLALVFIVPGFNNVINIFKDSCGLFKEVQWRALATAVVNLVGSIIFVNIIGINGVFVGTIVAYLTTIYIVDPRVVYERVFKMSIKLYYKTLAVTAIRFFAIFFVCFQVVKFVQITNFTMLIVMFVAISILANFSLWACCHKCEEYKYFVEQILRIIGKIKKLRK